MATMILELPYIFGTMPERTPIWKDIFLARLQAMKGALYFFKGGSVMMTVEQVAECIVGAIEQGEAGKRYPCGDENVDWDTWLTWIKEAASINKKIIHIPAFLGTLYGASLQREEKKQGKEGGLNYKYLFKDIQCNYLYYENFDTCQELGMSRGGVKESVIKTIQACLDS
jgi:nucleoside-diphosphate-sugar epimerase